MSDSVHPTPSPARVFPAPRLLLVAAAAGIPLLTLAGISATLAAPCLLALGAVGLWAWNDARRSRRLLLGLEVRTPADAAPLTVGREARASLLLAHIPGTPAPADGTLTLWMPPWEDAGLPARSFTLRAPAAAAGTRVEWTARPCARGWHQPEAWPAETVSPSGLWRVRRDLPGAASFSVHPDWFAGFRATSLLLAEGRLHGQTATRQLGKGREFDHLRQYATGDDYGDIDWRATARRGHPVTRVSRIERTQEVVLLVDHSRLSARPVDAGDGRLQPMLDTTILTAAALAALVRRQGDHVGLVAFASAVDRFIPAGSTDAHLHAVRHALHDLRPEPVSADFSELFSFVVRRLRKRSLLVLLTDLSDPLQEEELAESLRHLGGKHALLVGMPRHPGLRGLFTGAPPEDLDEVRERLTGELLVHQLGLASRRLARAGAEMEILDPPALAAGLFRRYLRLKGRQRL